MFPLWFKNEFFFQILQQNNSSPIRVHSFNAIPAVAAGNNYTCDLFRVKIQYEVGNKPQDISLIIKTALVDAKARAVVEQCCIMNKEFMMYTECLPFMEKSINKKLAPISYPCKVPDTLILEDLKEEGYIMCDRIKQLDLDHCLIFMKAIGIFHAASVYINKLNPALIERVGKELMLVNDEGNMFRQLMIDTCDKLASAIDSWGEFEQYANLFRNNKDKLFNKYVSLHKEKKHLLVLNHGDAWTNNMLFKYDKDGRVIDVKFIDFQLSKVGTPAFDLITFITTSAQTEVKCSKLHELYSTYLESLNGTLESLGCDERLTSEDLQDELQFAECWHFLILHMYLPIVLCDKGNAMNLEDVLGSNTDESNENNQLNEAFKGEDVQRICKDTFRMLDLRNVLSSLL